MKGDPSSRIKIASLACTRIFIRKCKRKTWSQSHGALINAACWFTLVCFSAVFSFTSASGGKGSSSISGGGAISFIFFSRVHLSVHWLDCLNKATLLRSGEKRAIAAAPARLAVSEKK